MAISLDSLYSTIGGSSSVEAGSLTDNIKNASSDEEMLEACKSFESYMLEQMYKSMEATVEKDEEDEGSNEYTNMFGDTLYQKYAEATVEAGGIGIAQMLYESMKNQSGTDTSLTNQTK